MLIGATIALFLATLWTWIGLKNLYEDRARLKARGFDAKLTIHYPPMIARHVVFGLAGAIIGYFVS